METPTVILEEELPPDSSRGAVSVETTGVGQEDAAGSTHSIVIEIEHEPVDLVSRKGH